MNKYLKYFAKNVLERLHALRKGRPWLATTAGVDNGTLGKYLAGSVAPGLEAICKISEALGCEPWELLKPAESAQDKSALITAVSARLTAMDEEQLRNFLEILNVSPGESAVKAR